MKTPQNCEVDVIVIGSGAGGMTAAITAKKNGLETIVIEKDEYFGGSTALSGGGIWAPNSPELIRNGVESSSDDVVEYLQHVTNGDVSDKKLRAYAEGSRDLFAFLEELSPVMKFRWSKGYSDYHPELPKGVAEGRSIECVPFNLKRLGEDAKKQRPPSIAVPLGMWLTASDFHDISMVMRSPRSLLIATGIGMRTVANYFTGRKMVALGQSLIGRLRFVMKELDIPLWLETAFEDLIVEDGTVVGAKVKHDGAMYTVRARRGVVLAAGGFDHNQELRRKYLPYGAQNDYSAGAESNTGDTLALVKKYKLATEFMDDAWWMPTFMLPGDAPFTLVSERAIPRSIIVGLDGKRFTNESSPYVNFVHDQIEAGHEYVWQIIDSVALKRYMYAGKAPGLPIPQAWFETGNVVKAESIDELAEKINVPATPLREEIAALHKAVEAGEDVDFHRGKSAYDAYYGDPSLNNPVLDRVDTPPYYAMRIVAGDLGTKGGFKTDEYARVMKKDTTVMKGLYATGNVAGSVMARDYAGAGATIGPAMIFGYHAARHMSEKERS